MGHELTTRGRAARALLGLCLLLVSLLAFAPSALADPPSHARAASLDIEGLNHACGVAADSKGDLYASSAGNDEIRVYDPSHTELTSIENTNEPCALAVDSKGNLYVTEKATGNVVRYTPNAYPFSGIPTYGAPTTIDSSGQAKGIAVDRTDDRLYVTQKTRVNVYKSDGSLQEINEVQGLNVNATSGSFKLKFEGQETTPIKFDASTEEVKAALEALSSIGAGNVEVKGTPPAYNITFIGALAHTDVEMLGVDFSGLAGGEAKASVLESTKGFNGHVGEGSLTNATGVAAYTYIYTGAAATLFRHYYLTVADAATDQVKVFSAREGTSLKLRRTISGVDHDEDPETPDQEFGFGAQGAYLAADPGNESRTTLKCAQVEVESQKQACTQGHFFLYDAEHNAVDELDATGEFVDQITNGSFADAEPTAMAVERSGGANDGTLYVSAGKEAGAKVLAFRPLGMPARDPLLALSHALNGARAVAVDCEGYVYVGAETSIYVYDPEGEEVTSFTDAAEPRDLAADCKGRVYVVDINNGEPILAYYTPSAYPPTASTTYIRTEIRPAEAESNGLQSVAIDPANEHAFVVGGFSFGPIIAEYGTPGEGSALVGECGEGLGLQGTRLDIDVYGKTGELYVTASQRNLATIRCGAEPERLIQQIKGGGCPSGEFGPLPILAVDQSNGHIIQFQGNQTGGAREYDSSGACVTEFGTFSTGSGNSRVAVDNSCALHDPPLTEQTTPKCSSLYPSNGNVYVAWDGPNDAVQPSQVNAFGPLEYPPPPGEPPTVETGEADGFGPGEAILHGTVNPNSSQVEGCEFEYLTEEEYEDNGETFAGAETVPCAESPEAIGNGGKAVPVHADVEGLELGVPYRYRLLASNQFGTGEGDPETFTLEPPLVKAKSALPVSYDEATLRGEVDPAGSPTEYRFEYLTQDEYEENGESFATAQSTPVGELAAGKGFVAVSASVTGLEEGTEYRFRLLAENDVGASEDEGPAFTTLVRPEPQECANAEYRVGFSAALPDCRAYELVTPAQVLSTTGGVNRLGSFSSLSGARFFNSWFVAPRGPEAGEALTYRANVPGIDSHPFRAERGEGDHPAEGWQSEPYGLTFVQGGGGDGEPGGVSADQRYHLYQVFDHETPTETSFPVGTYLRVPSGTANPDCTPEPEGFAAADPDGEFEMVGCGELGNDLKAEGRFVSAGGTHVIFTSKEQLDEDSPAAGVEAIYDRKAGEKAAEVVSVKPEPDGTAFGAGEAPRYLAATEDGEAVVFSTKGLGGPLYVHREGQTTQVAEGASTYAGISEDGKRVFFMDVGYFPGSGDQAPPPATLFACDVEGGNCAGPLKDQEPIEIAAQSSFVNVSGDGSSVFFTSKEDLAGTGMNENSEEAVAGLPNLYAWDGTAIDFIAVLDPQDLISFRVGKELSEELSREDLVQWTTTIPGQMATDGVGYESGRAYSPTRSTPDGEALVFQSHAQLTDYDNDGKGEIYRYAPAEPLGSQLTCVSCDPSGAPHEGIADTLFQTLFQGVTEPSTILANLTDDGERVFFESREALTPEDANEVADVYEWKAPGTEGPGGDTCEQARGCLALISTGQGELPSYFYGAGADGSDAFFITQEKLVGSDAVGSFSIYDARMLGGIPDPPLAAPCQGDACQGQGSTPPALPASATTGQANGNVAPAKPRCRKPKRRVKGRCIKPKPRKAKQHRKQAKKQRAGHNRGAGR